MRGPVAAVNKLADFVPIQMPPRRLTEVLREIIVYEAWCSEGEIPEELAERWEASFKAKIKKSIEKARSNSQPLQYELCLANETYIQGSCFIEPKDDKLIVLAKKNRANTFSYLAEFKSLTPSQFETLSGRVLSLFNVEEEFVTRASADQGIDFYGRVPFGELIKPSAIAPGAEKQLKIWLVGQSKCPSEDFMNRRNRLADFGLRGLNRL